MALEITIPDPFGTDDISGAYARVVQCNLDFSDKHGRITVNIYRDSESRDAGRPPVSQIGVTLSPTGLPALDEAGQPLTRQEDGSFQNANGDTVVPTTPPFPSFDQVMAMAVVTKDDVAGTPVFDLGKKYLYALVKSRPEFAGAKDV